MNYPACDRRTADNRCQPAEALLSAAGSSLPVVCIDPAGCVACQREGGPDAITAVMRKWAALADPALAATIIPPPPPPPPLGPGVGAEYMIRLKSRLDWPPCNNCYELARQMNAGGPPWCRANKTEIIRQTIANAREMYAAATEAQRAQLTVGMRILLEESDSLTGKWLQDKAKRSGLAWILRKAIAAEETRLATLAATEGRADASAATEGRPDTFPEDRDAARNYTAPQRTAPPARLLRPLLTITGDEPVAGRLAVVAALFNPAGYAAIPENWRRWRAMLQPLLDDGRLAHCVTAEALYGDQRQTVDADDLAIPASPADQVLWQKERLLNLAIAALPADVTAVAWIDPDITFLNPNWPEDTLRALTRFDVVQLFERVGVQNELNGKLPVLRGIVAEPQRKSKPGYAWAARRSVLTQGLYDAALSGSGDLLMAAHWLRQPWRLKHPDLDQGPALHAHAARWAAAQPVRSVGYVPGVAIHHFHGRREDRRYIERHHAARQHGFDPERDVEVAPNGLWRWTDPESPFARAMVEYFGLRNDDAGRN